MLFFLIESVTGVSGRWIECILAEVKFFKERPVGGGKRHLPCTCAFGTHLKESSPTCPPDNGNTRNYPATNAGSVLLPKHSTNMIDMDNEWMALNKGKGGASKQLQQQPGTCDLLTRSRLTLASCCTRNLFAKKAPLHESAGSEQQPSCTTTKPSAPPMQQTPAPQNRPCLCSPCCLLQLVSLPLKKSTVLAFFCFLKPAQRPCSVQEVHTRRSLCFVHTCARHSSCAPTHV